MCWFAMCVGWSRLEPSMARQSLAFVTEFWLPLTTKTRMYHQNYLNQSVSLACMPSLSLKEVQQQPTTTFQLTCWSLSSIEHRLFGIVPSTC
jgi:hypothetical protein